MCDTISNYRNMHLQVDIAHRTKLFICGFIWGANFIAHQFYLIVINIHIYM